MLPVSDVIPSRTTPYVTIGLIAVSFLSFVVELSLDAEAMRQAVRSFGFVPADPLRLTIVTSLFLHVGWIHLLGNMLYLWIFGDNVEDRLGHGRFLVFYLLGGAAAAIGEAVANPGSTVPVVGASGAVSSILGAYFVLYTHSRVLTAVFVVVYLDLIEIPAVYLLGIWFLVQVFSGLGSLGAVQGGTALWAHVAGFGTGLLVGAATRLGAARTRQTWNSY